MSRFDISADSGTAAVLTPSQQSLVARHRFLCERLMYVKAFLNYSSTYCARAVAAQLMRCSRTYEDAERAAVNFGRVFGVDVSPSDFIATDDELANQCVKYSEELKEGAEDLALFGVSPQLYEAFARRVYYAGGLVRVHVSWATVVLGVIIRYMAGCVSRGELVAGLLHLSGYTFSPKNPALTLRRVVYETERMLFEIYEKQRCRADKKNANK